MPALGQTPSQTVGPYYSMRLGAPGHNVLVPPGEPGRIRIVGGVYDGDGKPLEDALLETWQANAAGRYRHEADRRAEIPLSPGFVGFGRAQVDRESLEYVVETVKPGRVPAHDGSLQAPHVGVILHARGMLHSFFTRIYFADEAAANAADAILALVPAPRRRSLVAQAVDGAGVPTYRFDIRLQGPDETVFFDF